MKMLMPSNVRAVKQYSRRPAAVLADGRGEPARRHVLPDRAIAFRRYIVINQTEALSHRRQLRPLDP